MRKHRRILMSTAAIILLPSMALADGYKGVPAGMAVSSWTGFYVGGSAGVAMQTASADYSAAEAWDTDYSTDPRKSSRIGYLLGGQIGYNHQISNGVIGVEADYTFLSSSGGSVIGAYPDSGGSVRASMDARALATLRARFGYSFNSTLVYGTAGLGMVDVHDNVNVLQGAKGGNFSASKWVPAFVAGGGVEQMLHDRWSLRGEVLWVTTETFSAGPKDQHYYNTTTPPVQYQHDLVLGRMSLNYRF